MRLALPLVLLALVGLAGCAGPQPAGDGPTSSSTFTPIITQTPGSTATVTGPPFDGDLDARTVKSGNTFSDVGDGPAQVRTRFFTNEAEWREEWPPGQSEPEPVDFSRQVVLDVRWGPLPSSGHTVEFANGTWTQEDGYSVDVVLVRPGDGCAAGAVISEAYAWVAVDRVGPVAPDTPVQVSSREEARPC